MILHPEDYRLSLKWRTEAERTLKQGMSKETIETFVFYFWRALHPELYITPLTKDSRYTDLVIEIDFNHHPKRLYRPHATC